MQFIMNNLDEFNDFGIFLSSLLKENDVLVLTGDLGAGKTTLSQSIGKGLGICDYISSPTFTILNEYESGRLPLYHFDAYRITEDDFLFMDFEDYFYRNGVCLVEWGEIIKNLLPKNSLELLIKVDDGKRIVEFFGGERKDEIEKVIINEGSWT
ncbi:tRNA (adenosine(37)-N6)-threonylcarbamoyltransferase complex ATPase subunit type 1 TsaE [Peptoniphilus sp. GNH]|nr:hydrolase, P-loop family [Clostridiales bacterium KA00134]UHR02280.1 tRNA (adenosine(37)-N6)-threonylcarbamoyltransferase complex ATPase subunit type 1 TsaE [Peptoniphilus sp. GNH]